jgi:hypothetical protein
MSQFIHFYAEHYFADCHYAESQYDECRGARLLVLSTNNTICWKGLAGTNTPTYSKIHKLWTKKVL